MVTLANNHILDYGREGWNDTLDVLSKADMDYVGAGNNLDEASKIFSVDIKGKKLAVINCCEHEFTIASTDYPGANPLNPIAQYYKIKEAKESADYVIVIVHGGHEHFQLPSPRMKETYRFFVDAGADAVVNHHQHCFSGYEMYQDKPIIYGLGNFCFDSINNKYEGWYYGYMVEMNLDSQITFSIIPYEQCKAKPTVHLLPSDTFDQELAELNKIIADENMLSCKVNEYYSSSAKNYELVFSPLSNRYLVGAAYRRWIPTFLSAKKIMNILNYVDCESHRDRVIDMLLRMIK
jgi:poly-gamma-glutamate synthesis protein (capsule biosynthesis protein)